MYIYIYIYIQETKFEYITMKIKNKTGNIVQSSYLAASVNIIITKQKGNYVWITHLGIYCEEDCI